MFKKIKKNQKINLTEEMETIDSVTVEKNDINERIREKKKGVMINKETIN